jgi:AraC family transcriptional regulator of adaptative response / DNA-3-methyladenine glycosylase II
MRVEELGLYSFRRIPFTESIQRNCDISEIDGDGLDIRGLRSRIRRTFADLDVKWQPAGQAKKWAVFRLGDPFMIKVLRRLPASENVQILRPDSPMIRSTKSMNLSWQVCSRARLSRDARFDGKFFIAVLTTRIYCRPICPARTCKESNVRYYASAAAAAEAGFRPCLRCRPECSPGTPAWLGTPTTVSRALRLISENGLEAGVEGLAERVGVGARHLRRLFIQHLGATPSAVAQTRRLHFAKKLIDETTLPMSQIAIAAGFGCVRRFNAGIRKVYQRTPTQIRHLARRTKIHPEDQYLFRLPYRPPYDWQSMLAFLAARATPGIEAVDNGVYRRSISLDSCPGYFEVSFDTARDSLRVRVQFPDPRSLFFITERVRAMFDLNADWADIVDSLGSDPALRPMVYSDPGLRVPGCWSGFELAVRAILGEQASARGATSICGRVVRTFGKRFAAAPGLTHIFPSAEVLAEANLVGMRLPSIKAKAIKSLARAVCGEEIQWEGITDSEDFLTRLSKIPGVGRRTAQYVAMRTLNEPDAFPSDDRGLQRALGVKSSRELEQRAESWRPWRAYAALYLAKIGEEFTDRTGNRKKKAIARHTDGFHPLAKSAD